MTSRQTGDLQVNKAVATSGYGLGWSTVASPTDSPEPAPLGGFGHGGAYATDMWLDPQHQLVLVFMVQHAGYPGTDGPKILPAFRKAAIDAFGK